MVDKGWKIASPDNENIATMLSYPPKYYEERIKKLGFTGEDKVLLDAGCGAGYWSAVGSYLNEKVSGIDLTEKYLNYARKIKSRLNRQNIDLKLGNVEKLPYKDSSFDYIICYSVWMFLDKEKALREFRRVLKPAGRLYLGSLIGLSWYPRVILKAVKEGKPGIVYSALAAIFKGIPLTEKKTRQMLENNGFKIIDLTADGEAGKKKIKIKPIYNAKRWGFWEIFEVLAEKIK